MSDVVSGEEKKAILLNNVPMDVINEIDRRAGENYRSRTGEILAILTCVCRGGATLPGLGVGDMVPASDGTNVPCVTREEA